MSNRHFARWAASLVLASCAGNKPIAVNTQTTPIAAAAPDPKGVGLDMADLDRTVSPCDDFFQFSGGNWLRNNPVPSYASSWGPRTLLGNRTQALLRKVLEDAAASRTAVPGSNAQKVGDFYAAAMDTVAIDRAGIEPLRPELDRVAGVRSLVNLRAEMVHLQELGIGAFFNVGVDVDEKQTTQYAVQIYQDGLTLPNREFYFNTDARTEKVKAAYRAYMQQVFALLGSPTAVARLDAAAVERIETRLAKASRTPVELRDPQANYNKLTVAAAQQRYPVLDPMGLLAGLQLGKAQQIIVGQPAFLDEVNAVLKTESISDLKTYLRWHLLRSTAAALPTHFAEAAFRFSQSQSGAKQQASRWKRIQAVTDQLLGEAFGQLYVDQAFSPEAKAKALEMVNNIKASMAEHIQTNTWMSVPTKAEALKKLRALRVKVGYPDVWKDYSALTITRESYLKNLLAARQWEQRRRAAHLGQPIDRNEWEITPPTINAYYNPAPNEIVFAAGFLQPPFFDPRADDAISYGAIGGVMGHELTHAFDDEGRQYDSEGTLRDWWTPQDAAEFTKRAAVVRRQYDAFTPLDSVHVNGQLTLGENLADFAGLTVVYGALQKQLQQRYGNGPRPKFDGFTPEQRYFLSWAQLRRINIRPEALRQQIATDLHSPGYYRTIGPIMNMPEFQQAFGCAEGSRMTRKAVDRAVIW
jgi:putative endopeptidase